MTTNPSLYFLKQAIAGKQVCRLYMSYAEDYRYGLPIDANSNLFMYAQELDFMIDGFVVRRMCDLDLAEFRQDLSDRILIEEGIIDSIIPPKLDISNWATLFNGLWKLNKCIIIEDEIGLSDDSSPFIIGFITAVGSGFADVLQFDADGIWYDYPTTVYFDHITSVSVGTRYAEYFAKYVGKPPVSKKQQYLDNVINLKFN